jgi:hypothetical protein
LRIADDDHDLELRRAAMDHVRRLSRAFDDLIPVAVLRQGSPSGGRG